MTSTSSDQGRLSGFPSGISLRVEGATAHDEILTPEALAFVAALAREFEPERRALMQARSPRQAEADAGCVTEFLTIPGYRHLE